MVAAEPRHQILKRALDLLLSSVGLLLSAPLWVLAALTIKLGFVEGKVVQPAELKALADLPSKEALRSQLVGALQGPLSQLVSLLTAPQRELVQVLEARSKSTAEQPAAS